MKVKGSDFRVYSRAKRLSRMIWKAEDLFNYGKQVRPQHYNVLCVETAEFPLLKILAREIAASGQEGGLKLRLMGLRMTSLASREIGDEGIVKVRLMQFS